MFKALLHYVRDFPYVLIAPLMLQRQMPDGNGHPLHPRRYPGPGR